MSDRTTMILREALELIQRVAEDDMAYEPAPRHLYNEPAFYAACAREALRRASGAAPEPGGSDDV